MRVIALSSWPLLMLALAACTEDRPVNIGPSGDAATNKDATSTSTPSLDGATSNADASDPSDSGPANLDATNLDAARSDALANPDATVNLGPSCTELQMCCGTLQFGQQQCFDRAALGDEAGCQMLLAQAQGGGLCLPPGHDAGERPEGGTLSPQCAALEPCCAQAGALAGACTNIVQADDAARCQQILDLLAAQGIMCAAVPMSDGGQLPDAGQPPVCQCDITRSCDQNCICDPDCAGTPDAGP